MRACLLLFILGVMISVQVPSMAHHGPGPFDRSLGVVLEDAKVTAWRYVHPHASVLVE